MKSLGDCVNFNFNFNFSFMGSRYFFWLFKFTTVERPIYYSIDLITKLTYGVRVMPSDVNVAATELISRVQTTLFTPWAKFSIVP
jgi:hypothetical protein